MPAQPEHRPENGSIGGTGDIEHAVAVTSELLAELRPTESVRVAPASELERDLGLDSLALMELRERLEAALACSISDDALADARTLGDLLHAAGKVAVPDAPTTATAGPVREIAPRVGAPGDTTTLLEVLDWYTDHHPEGLHLRLIGEQGGEEALTFAGLRSGAERIAAGLQEAGARPGQAVALMLPTSRAYFEAFFGAVLAGAVPVPIYPPARRSQIADHVRRHTAILDNARACVLVTVPEARSVARLLRANVPSLIAVTTPEEIAGTGARARVVAPSSGQLALIQYTSGSTATPKGVEVTHENVLTNIRAMAEVAEVDPACDVFVSWLPLYHDMGLIGAWFGSLTCGMPLVVMPPLTFLSRPARWLEAIHTYGGTISAAPNFAYELCCTRIRDEELEGIDLASWRLALNGAEPVSPDTLERFRDRYRPHGFRPEAMAPVYGLAETALGLTFPPPGREPRIDRAAREPFLRTGHAEPAARDDPHPLRVVGCGFPVPGHEVRIADEAGRDAGERRQGRIMFRGPSATRGYHRDPGETRRLFDGDWADSGDLGYLADGELFVTGRMKDLIIRGGRNLHPQEIEDAVGSLEGVRRGCVAAVAATDEATGTERLVVVAETRERTEEARSGLRQRIRATVSDVTGLPPDEVVLAPPGGVLKTSSGKIRRAATREQWEAGALDKPVPGVWRQVLRLGVMGARPQARRAGRVAADTAYGVFAWALAAIVLVPTLVALTLLPRRDLRWRVARGALRATMRGGRIRLDVVGADQLPDEPYVLIAPHGSPLDGPALVAGIGHRLTFVVIEQVARVPVVGHLLRRLGVQFIDREHRGKAARAADRFVEALDGGERIVVFPESTMSALPGLRSFRMGAFTAAARARVPVVPVGVEGTREMLGPHDRLPRPGHIRVVVGEPIRPQGTDGWKTALDLRDRARAQLLELLDVPDLVT